MQQAAPILDSYIAEQAEKYKIPSSKIALVGFSQGTMMSLYVGPHYPEMLAGVLGYSGALVWEDAVDSDSLQKIPVHLVHGDIDPVVPLPAYYHARQKLEQAGFEVTGGVTRGLMHNIDDTGIEDGMEFLHRVLR